MLRPAPRSASWRFLPLLALALALPACDSSDGDGSDGLDPADADALTQALAIAGAARIDGSAPAPSTDPDAPDIANAASALTLGPGGTATVSFSVDGADGLAGFFLQLTGADAYIDAPLAQFDPGSGIGTFQFDLPAGVDEGGFELNYCVYTDDDDDGEPDLISNVLSTDVDVQNGAGDAGSTGLGTSTVSIGGEAFAGSAYAYQVGGQLALYLFDGDPGTYAAGAGRAAYFSLTGADGTGAYAVDGQQNAAVYLDYRQGQPRQFLIGSGGTVTLDQVTGRLVGSFDVSGTDLAGGGGSFSGSFDAVLNVGQVPTVPGGGGGSDGGNLAWSDTAIPYRGRNGERITFTCAAGGTPRTVWGTDVYTDDSSVCTAAVHAGAITVADGGDIVVEILPGQSGYTGSTRNGITSSNWGSWSGSFSIVD